MKRILMTIVLMMGMIIPIFPSPAEASVTITSYTNMPSYPKLPLRHDWGPAIVIESGVANSCITRDSEVSGRRHLCRVIDGYEEIGDTRNFKIVFTGGSMPYAFAGSSSSYHGFSMVLKGGDGVFEGCKTSASGDPWVVRCDYRQRKPIVLRTSGGAYSYVLRKLWNWTRYIGNAAGCAGGIVGLWAGKPVTLPLLADCVDGPM